jgi:hypothetical protein
MNPFLRFALSAGRGKNGRGERGKNETHHTRVTVRGTRL